MARGQILQMQVLVKDFEQKDVSTYLRMLIGICPSLRCQSLMASRLGESKVKLLACKKELASDSKSVLLMPLCLVE